MATLKPRGEPWGETEQRRPRGRGRQAGRQAEKQVCQAGVQLPHHTSMIHQRRSFCCSSDCTESCVSDTSADYEGYSVSSKRFLPTIPWSPDVKSQLTGKDSDAGKN